MTTILILPGWQDSGDDHWQGIWLKKYPNAVKIEQDDWMTPKKVDWVKRLNEYIEKYDDIVFVGHSLACATFAHWVHEHPENLIRVKGALLVSPSDMDMPGFPAEISGFSPMPLWPINLKTVVVTSSNDKWVSIDRATEFAEKWGAELVKIDAAGHINTESGFGDWPQGEELLNDLLVDDEH